MSVNRQDDDQENEDEDEEHDYADDYDDDAMMIWSGVCSRVGSHREAATLSGLSEYLATIQGFKQVTLPRIWMDNNRWIWMDNKSLFHG